MDEEESPSYYDILEVQQNAKFDEIKKSYQQLILKYHPDKQDQDNIVDKHRFQLIDEAWKVLRDSERRKKYDAELLQRSYNEQSPIFATVTKDDFTINKDKDLYCYPCRCGGAYIFPVDDLEECTSSCYISCDECSYVVEFMVNLL